MDNITNIDESPQHKIALIEYMPFRLTPTQLQESMRQNNGKIIVEGICQRADEPNQNGRIYPFEILNREVKKYQALIDERRALGELEHPETHIVNLKNVSHNIVKL